MNIQGGLEVDQKLEKEKNGLVANTGHCSNHSASTENDNGYCSRFVATSIGVYSQPIENCFRLQPQRYQTSNLAKFAVHFLTSGCRIIR